MIYQNQTKNQEYNYIYLACATVVAIFFLWLHSRNCPVHPGRDMITYWMYYYEYFKIHPESPTLMLFRTPVTPFFFGLLYDFVGITGLTVVLSILYVICLVTVYVIGSTLSVWIGFLALVALGADIQYHFWFFSVGSESPQSFLLILWFAYSFFTFNKTEKRYWIVHALIVWVLILNRPGNQIMLLCCILPLLNTRAQLSKRLVLVLVFVLTYGFCHIGYSTHNYHKVGKFQISTLGNAHMPFYRLYLQDDLISPDNGPKSQELANLVEEEILTLDLYQQYKIDKDIFFNFSTQRMYSELIKTVEEKYGWDHQWLILREAAIEAILAEPLEVLLTYIDHVRDVFYIRGGGQYDLSKHKRSKVDQQEYIDDRYRMYERIGLPIPSEGDLLPEPQKQIDNAEIEDYQSKTFFGLKTEPVKWTFNSYCKFHWGEIFDIYNIKFPFSFMYLVIGLVGLVRVFMCGRFYPYVVVFSLTGISFLTLGVTLMGTVQFPFRFPYDPILILFGCFGLHGLLSKGQSFKSTAHLKNDK